MSIKMKAIIAAVVILLIAVFGAYKVASSVSTKPDTEELVARLQSISQQIVEDNKDKKPNQIMTIVEQIDDVTTILSYTDKNITITVSASLTKITTNLDYDWNIINKSVYDFSKPFGPNMFILTIIFILVGCLIWLFSVCPFVIRH